MKQLLACFAIMALGLSSCVKVETGRSQACSDTPPKNELCAAAFNRWFYDTETQQCKLVSYSGCSQKGFASEADCKPCK